MRRLTDIRTNGSAPEFSPVRPSTDLHTEYELIPFLEYPVNEPIDHRQKYALLNPETQIRSELLKTDRRNFELFHYFPYIC